MKGKITSLSGGSQANSFIRFRTDEIREEKLKRENERE